MRTMELQTSAKTTLNDLTFKPEKLPQQIPPKTVPQET